MQASGHTQHRKNCCGGSGPVANMIQEGVAKEYIDEDGYKMLAFREDFAGEKEANFDSAETNKATLALHARTF